MEEWMMNYLFNSKRGLVSKFLISFSFIFILSLTSGLNAQSWNALGTGTSGNVNAVTVFNGQLIAAGSFTTAGGVTVNNVAAWNGTSWSALGTGTDGVVYSLTIYAGQLVAAGGFSNAGGVSANHIARWNGTVWTNFGLGTNDTIYALAVFGGNLRAGGKFTTAGGVTCTRLASFNGTSWAAMGGGVNNSVYAMTVNGGNLVIGGSFTQANGFLTVNRITNYNGFTYSALGTGIDSGQVQALSVFGGSVYAGGVFRTIGGATVNNIARWSGTNWNPVGSGITPGNIKSLSVSGAALIVGGNFTNASGTSANSIVSWSGSAFSALGNGITGGSAFVNGITTWSNVLIAGGSFTTAGTVSASNIAGYGSVPIAPTLISPADGATNVTLTPGLVWSSVANATTYGVQVSTSPNFTTFIVNAVNLLVPTDTLASGLLMNSTTYFWRATASNGLGTSPFSLVRFFTTQGPSGIINNQTIPLSFKLYQNYPNPFNPVTQIKFDLPENNTPGAKLNFTIYNAEGQVVSSLLNQEYTAGQWEISFDASNYSSGVYFYKLTAGNYTATNKMVLVK